MADRRLKRCVFDPEADHAMVKEGIEAMRREYPALGAVRVVQSWGGMIDSTPDAVPVISSVDKLPGLFISAGYSAHGFGIGPGAGSLMSDLVTGSTPVVDPTAFRFDRFSDGSNIKEPGMM